MSTFKKVLEAERAAQEAYGAMCKHIEECEICTSAGGLFAAAESWKCMCRTGLVLAQQWERLDKSVRDYE